MSLVVIRRAAPSDWPRIATLLARCALPLDGARVHLDSFRIAMAGDDLLGTAGLEPYGATGLLRSVAVDPGHHGRSIGGRLVDDVVQQAAARDIDTLYLLTTTARDWFIARGFVAIDRDALPEVLHASAELRGACPASATCMTRRTSDVR